MKIQPDLARFIHNAGGGLIESRRPAFLLARLIMVWFAFSLSAQAEKLDDLHGPSVLQTSDGQIIAGHIVSSSNGQLKIDTKFGDLLIQWADVARANGEVYDHDVGIVREHTIVLRPDRSAKVDALVPVSLKNKSDSVTFLALGRVLQVLDLDGHPLGFSTSVAGDFSRCVVNAMPYRVPAMQVQTVVPEAAVIENGVLKYEYDYTPRIEQTFQLNISIPAGAQIQAATPMPNKVTNSELQWSIKTISQKALEFQLDLKLAAN